MAEDTEVVEPVDPTPVEPAKEPGEHGEGEDDKGEGEGEGEDEKGA